LTLKQAVKAQGSRFTASRK